MLHSAVDQLGVNVHRISNLVVSFLIEVPRHDWFLYFVILQHFMSIDWSKFWCILNQIEIFLETFIVCLTLLNLRYDVTLIKFTPYGSANALIMSRLQIFWNV